MWSLYSNCYEGYCIEYKNINKLDFLQNFKPVIYTRTLNNDNIKSQIKYYIEIIKNLINDKADIRVGIQDEILCIKDSNWSFQDERRILGKANTRYKLEINAIYLGFKINKTNEKRMKEYARQKGFSLYKMLDPAITNKIKYIKIM